MAELQSVSGSATNIVAPFALTESEVEISEIPPASQKPTKCFWCKKLLFECANPNHWEKKLATEGLSDGRGMAPRGGKNFVLINDESLEKIERDEIQKEIGRVTPSGQSPDPEDTNLESSLDFHWAATQAWRAVEELEAEFVRCSNYLDIAATLRRWVAYPPYLQAILVNELLRNPAVREAVETLLSHEVEFRTLSLRIACRTCGAPAELTLKVYGNATIEEPPTFTCADCLGRLTDFTPRSRLRKYPRCRRKRITKAA